MATNHLKPLQRHHNRKTTPSFDDHTIIDKKPITSRLQQTWSIILIIIFQAHKPQNHHFKFEQRSSLKI